MSLRFFTILQAFVLVFFFVNDSLFADENTQESNDQAKIQFLLKRVEKSEGVFIRNGEEHPAGKAKDHLEHKMNMARKMFWFFGPSRKISIQEFIEKIASKSSTTGEVYKIRLKDGTTLPTGDWLKEQLKDFPQKSESP